MDKERVLYVITKLELGGAQKQLLSLCSGLDKEKFAIYLFTADSGLLVEDASKVFGINLYLSKFLDRPINPFKDLLAFFEIASFIKSKKINVVHTHSSKAGILGRLAARVAGVKRIVHTVHGWSFNDFQPYLSRHFYILLERLCARLSDKIVVVSEYDKEKGLSEHIGGRNQYLLIPYGIDHSEFKAESYSLRKEFGIPSSVLLVGMIACFKSQKAPQDFIEAARLITSKSGNVKFIMIGDGQMRGHVQELISRYQLQDKVILAGWRRDIPQVLCALDIFVLTSLYEGMPIVVLEAMAAAKPVVATNTGGIAEVIKDGEDGFLVTPKAPQEMADRIFTLLTDENLRKRLGENASLSVSENFSVPSMVLAHQQLYLKSITPG